MTGSRYLVTWGERRVLVDCGQFQGWKQLRLRNWVPFPFDPAGLDAVVLTHAHIDHSGALPLLVRGGFRGPVHCTAATADLCRLLLPDAAHIQEQDAERANRRKYTRHAPALPLFTTEDAKRALAQLVPHPFDETIELGGLAARLIPAGHLLGAAQVHLHDAQRSLRFSGDLGRPCDLVMPPPAPGSAVDVLVVESTYGDRIHGGGDVAEELAIVIRRTAERGGAVLVPSFAVGRAHALLYLVQKLQAEGRIPRLPVFLDSPMAISAMDLYCQHHDQHRLDEDTCRRTCEVATYVRDVADSRALNDRKDPRIVIAASGMLTGGRVLHHLQRMASDARNTVLFVGYQAAGTRGAQMLAGAPTVKVHGQEVRLRAEVASLSALSGHADSDELMAWLRTFPGPPAHTFITHGEPAASDALRRRIKDELGWTCRVPEDREVVSLDPAGVPAEAGL